jgi:hypothetical protein
MLVLAVLEVVTIRMKVRLHTSAQSFLRVVVAVVGQMLVKRRSVAVTAVLVAVRLAAMKVVEVLMRHLATMVETATV